MRRLNCVHSPGAALALSVSAAASIAQPARTVASQQAQRSLRNVKGRNGTSYAQPYYWAGFFVSGSGP